MKKTMKKSLLLAGAALTLPAAAAASGGIVGACVDCHTMHNSFQGVSVTGGAPIQNLLKYDCVGCHAIGGDQKIADMGGGTAVPQVYHNDPSGDLAGGNFAYIDNTKTSPQTNTIGDNHRKGHNVTDLLVSDSTFGAVAFGAPPGTYRPDKHAALYDGQSFVQSLTCAGAGGCHGTRNQAVSGTPPTTVPGDDNYTNIKLRQGIAAISGAHHANSDGAKNPGATTAGVHSGVEVAASYRFILGLKGYEVEGTDRWQNIQGSTHNEYYGAKDALPQGTTVCNVCHVEGGVKFTPYEYLATDSKIKVPNQSMSGFCATCHGAFHSVGSAGNTLGEENGVSGAFLRHPSDYVLPGAGTEYAGYTYDITAPVARSTVPLGSSNDPGTEDMVMCLSCHLPHASPYDSMLRFDYAAQTQAMSAGTYTDSTAAKAAGGCLACHTWKGVLPGPGRI